MTAPKAGRVRTALLASAAVLLLAGCESDAALDPVAFAPEPCSLVPTFTLPAGQAAPSAAGVSAVLTDSAERLTLSFAEPARSELRDALRAVAGEGGVDVDARCRGLLVARDLLSRGADDPATLPDRAAIRLALDLATATLPR